MPTDIVNLLGSQLAPLLAYIGPGADLALVSSVIGLVFTMGTSVIFLVLWPIRWAWRRLCALGKEVHSDSATRH